MKRPLPSKLFTSFAALLWTLSLSCVITMASSAGGEAAEHRAEWHNPSPRSLGLVHSRVQLALGLPEHNGEKEPKRNFLSHFVRQLYGVQHSLRNAI